MDFETQLSGAICDDPDRPPDLEVDLLHYSTEEGGLKGPLMQGCRLPNDFGLAGQMNDAMYIFKAEPPGPGERAFAELWLLVPELNAGRLREGFKFFPWHMSLIGEGIVTRVINPSLQKSVQMRPKSNVNAKLFNDCFVS